MEINHVDDIVWNISFPFAYYDVKWIVLSFLFMLDPQLLSHIFHRNMNLYKHVWIVIKYILVKELVAVSNTLFFLMRIDIRSFMLPREVVSNQNHPIVCYCATYTPVLFDALNFPLMYNGWWWYYSIKWCLHSDTLSPSLLFVLFVCAFIVTCCQVWQHHHAFCSLTRLQGNLIACLPDFNDLMRRFCFHCFSLVSPAGDKL